MNRHQRFLFEMLKEIRSICDANDITYFVGMGTLLGAVRNEGFLPWDDDLDILMTYDNWVKFKEVCKTALPENRYLGSADTDDTYTHLLPRYISRDTTAIHQAQSLHECVAGELIDIFVLDPIADGDEAFDAYLQDIHLQSMLVNYATVAGYKCEVDPELLRRNLMRIRQEGQAAVIRELEHEMASRFDENGSRYAFRWQGVTICFDRSWFEETTTVRFEGEEFTAPGCLNRFLTRYYGEQWYEVPSKVNPAKHATAFSLDMPYDEALEYYEPPYDRAKLRLRMDERRVTALELAPVRNGLNDDACRARSFVAARHVANMLDEHGEAFDRAVRERDIATLNELLREYLAWQMSPKMVGSHADKWMYRVLKPMLVDVPDRVFEGALVALMGAGRVSHAAKLLSVRRRCGKPFSDEMRRIDSDIEAFRQCMDDLERGSYADGLQRARELVARHDHVAAFAFAACALAKRAAQSDGRAEAFDEYSELVASALRAFPGDGAFEVFEADVLERAGDAEGARILRVQAAERTRNGLLLHEVYERTGYHPRWLRTAQWAREYGIAEWEGDEPDTSGLPARPAAKPAVSLGNERDRALVHLLGEVAQAAETTGARCVMAPALARAICKKGQLPRDVALVELVCPESDMDDLGRELARCTPDGRALDIAHGIDGVPEGSLLYSMRHSLSMSLESDEEPALTRLRVAIKPLARKSPSKKDDGSSSLKHAASSFVRRLLKRDERRAERDDGGSAPSKLVARTAWGKLAIDEGSLDGVASVAFRGVDLPVLKDVDAYLKPFAKKRLELGQVLSSERVESCCISAGELYESGALPRDYWKRKRAYRKGMASARAARTHFIENFEAICAAVDKKSAEKGASS